VDPDPTRDADRSNHAGVIVYGNEAIDRWAACPAKAKPENIIDLIDWMNRSRPPLYHGLNRPRKFRS
jgi:protein SCO1/2